jgi:hypothetical protein
MDFQKLTIKAQEAVAAAQELARRRGNRELYPEHSWPVPGTTTELQLD